MQFYLLESELNFSNANLQDYPESKPVDEIEPNSLIDLLPELPLWVMNPDYERVITCLLNLNSFILISQVNFIEVMILFVSVCRLTGSMSL